MSGERAEENKKQPPEINGDQQIPNSDEQSSTGSETKTRQKIICEIGLRRQAQWTKW
jgi:hypothetical protein